MTLLGTAAAAPTKERGLPAVVLEREGDVILFDCGEGTQRQMVTARPTISNPRYVFVTHLHGDHFLGLLGLLQSLALQNRAEPLDVFGPKGLDKIIEFNVASLHIYMPYSVLFHRVSRGTVLEARGLKVSAAKTAHTSDSFAYRLDESSRPGRFFPERAEALGVPRGPLWGRLQKGRTVVVGGKKVTPSQVCGPKRRGRSFGYSGDARPTKELEAFFKGVDLLIFDGTYIEEFADKAREYGHSTVSEAAALAARAKVGRLILTHISARVNDASLIQTQASKCFSNVVVGEDFARYELTLPE